MILFSPHNTPTAYCYCASFTDGKMEKQRLETFLCSQLVVEPGFKLGHSEAAEFTFLPAVRYCVSQPFVRNLFWQNFRIQRQCLVSQGMYTFVYIANHNVKNTQKMGQKLLFGS